jgi:hypothetical protein
VNKIDEVFADYFKTWEIRLPTEATQDHQPGEIRSHGWTIQFHFRTNERGDFLDFYASHRMTNDRHLRIYESGETERLPAYWGMIIYPADATEKQKEEAERHYQKHNAEVSEDLKRKGFRLWW